MVSCSYYRKKKRGTGMQEKRITLNEEDNELFVNEMLKGNEVIEDALANWKEDSEDSYAMAYVYKAILERDNQCGGLIISVKDDSILAGADNIKYYNGSEQITLNKVKGLYDDHYLLVFTSRERFKECNETAGVVMFIREAFYLLAQVEGVDGIVLNIGKEEIILNKNYMELMNKLIQKDIDKKKGGSIQND